MDSVRKPKRQMLKGSVLMQQLRCALYHFTKDEDLGLSCCAYRYQMAFACLRLQLPINLHIVYSEKYSFLRGDHTPPSSYLYRSLFHASLHSYLLSTIHLLHPADGSSPSLPSPYVRFCSCSALSGILPWFFIQSFKILPRLQ